MDMEKLPAAASSGKTELNQPFPHQEQQKCKWSLMSICIAQGFKMYFVFFISLYQTVLAMILSPGFALSPAHFLFYLLFSTAAHQRMSCALIHLRVFHSHKCSAPGFKFSFKWDQEGKSWIIQKGTQIISGNFYFGLCLIKNLVFEQCH